MLNEIIEVQSLNLAKLFREVYIFILFSIACMIIFFLICKNRKLSLKYFLICFILYFFIVGGLFFNGIRPKKILDTGYLVINYVKDFQNKNGSLPKSLDELYLMNEEKINQTHLNCCIEYKYFEYQINKITNEKGFHYEKIPGESFALVIKPEKYFRYFIYNEDENEFEMRE